jgi:hypothetical protein
MLLSAAVDDSEIEEPDSSIFTATHKTVRLGGYRNHFVGSFTVVTIEEAQIVG